MVEEKQLLQPHCVKMQKNAVTSDLTFSTPLVVPRHATWQCIIASVTLRSVTCCSSFSTSKWPRSPTCTGTYNYRNDYLDDSFIWGVWFKVTLTCTLLSTYQTTRRQIDHVGSSGRGLRLFLESPDLKLDGGNGSSGQFLLVFASPF